jgi:5'(3')-deoxyribonucleotidase
MATIFLDMDGVVADFDGYAEPLVGYRTPGGVRYNDPDWKKISANKRLYSQLAKCPNADRVVNEVLRIANEHGYEVRFLTAIPRQNDVPWAFWDKIKWIERYYPNIPVWFGPYSVDKQVHYQPGDILIDDRDSNIEEWRSRGGRAILHEGDVIATLFELRSLVDGAAG